MVKGTSGACHDGSP
ncbi:unnamed protein product, partial [Allacma fusca]